MLKKHIFTSTHADNKERLINHSALFWCSQRGVITCGTHFEDTKLVASITGRPVPESMSISWIFTPVGTISWGTMKLKLLFLDLIPCKVGGITRRHPEGFKFWKNACQTHLYLHSHAESCTCSFYINLRTVETFHNNTTEWINLSLLVGSLKLWACNTETIKQWHAQHGKLSQEPCHHSYSISKKMWNICPWQIWHTTHMLWIIFVWKIKKKKKGVSRFDSV